MMTIPHDVQRRWESLRERGDVKKLAAKTGKTTVTISNALNSGKCSRIVYGLISNYYAEVEKEIDSYNTVEE